MHVPHFIRQPGIFGQQGNIEQENEKVDHHINAESGNDPEILSPGEIILIGVQLQQIILQDGTEVPGIRSIQV